MPTPPLTDEQCAETINAVRRYGGVRQAAKALNQSESKIRHQYGVAKARGLHLSEGARDSIDRSALGYAEARGGYRRVYDEDGKQIDTVRYTLPVSEEDAETVTERIRATLEGLAPAPRVAAPKAVSEGLLGLHVIADVHMGATIEADESGETYGVEIAKERLKAGFAHCAQAMPACEVCVILFNGDTTHANCDKNRTPKSGHPLKVEGSHQSNLFAVEEIIGWQVELALAKHGRVLLVIKRGNHDPNTPAPLIMAMRAFYRNNPRVTVIDDEDPYFVFQMGRVFLCSHHGDGAAPAKRAVSIPHKFRREWGVSDFHWFFTGDKHHSKSDTFGGLHWRQVPSVINLEQHSHAEGYADTSGMYAAWFDTATGRVSETTIRF